MVKISQATTPKAHISDAVVNSIVSQVSGAIQRQGSFTVYVHKIALG